MHGMKPAVRYSLPASSFKVGSAELPELLKKQLDVFAEVLRGKKGAARRSLSSAIPMRRVPRKPIRRSRSDGPKP